jgi:hypothetical protein
MAEQFVAVPLRVDARADERPTGAFQTAGADETQQRDAVVAGWLHP